MVVNVDQRSTLGKVNYIMLCLVWLWRRLIVEHCEFSNVKQTEVKVICRAHLTHRDLGKDATLASVEHSHETNEHETFSNQTISMDRFRPRYFKYDKYKNLYSFSDHHQKIINLLFHSVMWETAGLTTTTTVSGKTTTETTQMKPTTLTSLQDGLFLQDQGTKHEETFENHLKGRSLTCGTTMHCFLRPALPVTGPQCTRIWIIQGEKFKPTFAFRSPLGM